MKSIRVLLSPMDWGLGHATRCVPIIRSLLNFSVEVTIAGSGASLQLLKEEFPTLAYLDIPTYEIRYGNHFNLSMLKQMPKFLNLIEIEKKLVNAWQQEYVFDLIISDNRYGFSHEHTPSIFISHQLSPKFPKGFKSLTKPAQVRLNKWMNAFTEIWVPDFDANNNLSGSLSVNTKLNPPIHFIGPLSRFKNRTTTNSTDKIVAIISGPDPARAKFETHIVDKLQSLDQPSILIRGLPNERQTPDYGGLITVYNHLQSKELNDILLQAKLIISRAGYSTIMDLFRLNKPAILVPTPGQSEQEYLAQHLSGFSSLKFYKEDELIIDLDFNPHIDLQINHESGLEAEIQRVLKKIKTI